ncbi:C4-dicarboxylate transporter DctM subunit [Mesorhizobium sp. J18]|uniref:TRAP transporter large permease n=1 Tax=Mesorhizobium sp. J18 TaxID=935263 RepID=UPI0011997722|nr:TRAP transporter large permease [Mesorhizobium sp. J18]TWG96397.1 C4-dicarboxylate transporter DctM subunit [Mesorhizobium sp. J18]
MTTAAIILCGGFLALIIVGMPFALAIAVACMLVVLFKGMEPAFLAAQLISGSQSFSLLAVPLFILAGGLMGAGGITTRLIGVANVLVRHFTGGLAMVVVVAATIFGSISGSAPATTAAVAAMMIPAMVAAGYDKAFATSICVSAGVLGPLLPPSIAFVIWGVIAEQSIPKLFLSGIVPGLTIAAGLLGICYFHARRNNLPREKRADLGEIATAVWDGKWALLSPFVVLGGIYGGIFTPTEAAAISCVYALVIGALVERKFTWGSLTASLGTAARTSSVVLSIVVVSAAFGVLVAQERVALNLATYLAEAIDQRWIMLAGINVAIFVLAAFMDEVAIMLILGPLLISLANQFGVDPIHFGSIIVTNVAIGMAAPPIGYCLFVGMAVSGLTLGQISRAIWPQIIVMLVVLFLTTYIPQFALVFVR